MRRLYILIIFMLVIVQARSYAQGCVAIRSSGNSCSLGKPGDNKAWQLNLNNRYFKSYKHFVGKEEQKEREENHTEVINYSYSMDITVTRQFTNRWSVSATIPFISNSRSSLYEHGGNAGGEAARHSTQSIGLGDARIAVYRWLLNPAKSHKGNLQAGLGIKLPTGNYKYEDYFFKADGSTVIGPVDQSIQLGDGGTGFTAELNGFYNFSHRVGVYANGFYLLNPREQNGVSATRGSAPNAAQLQYFTSTMSVPDQYMARAGVNVMANKFSIAAGARLEGIPSSDLVGGDRGFRRPGYVLSIEPTVAYSIRKTSFYLAVPVAIERNRTKSFYDKIRSKEGPQQFHGDAAFADYLINAGVTFNF